MAATKKQRNKIIDTPKRKVGRPSSYTDKVGKYICQEIMKGRTITSICKKEGMPCLPTVFNWLNKLNNAYNEDFLKSYSQAREVQAEVMADEIKDIADNGENDTYVAVNPKTGKKELRINYDHIKRSALRVDSRKWLAAHLLPRKFSDRMELTGAGGKDLNPVPTNIVVNFVKPEKKDDK